MKTRYFIILAAVLGLISCNKIVTYKTDLPDRFTNEGAPQIDSIFDIRDAKLETKLTEGSLAQILHIKGKNLANPKSIAFNGIEANLDLCYCEKEDSYIVIPRVLPDAVDNKIVYTTDQGSASFAFEVKIPQLSLEGLANEFALPGSSVQVVGDFFDLFEFGVEGSPASITIGDTPVQIDSLSETYMSIVIPEGTPDNSRITFSWEDVTLGKQTKVIPYRNTSMMFVNLDEVGYWDNAIRDAVVTDGSHDGDPQSLGYTFTRFNMPLAAWTWYSIGMGGDFPLDINWETEMENLVFKCEIWTNSSNPIPTYTSGNGVLVQFNTKENVSLDLGGSTFNTGGEWRTCSWPLSSVASEMPAAGVYWNFALAVQPPVDWTIDFALANFRFEPASY